MKPSCILVIGHERLYSELKKDYQSIEGLEVIKLSKSGGVSVVLLILAQRTYENCFLK
jgi:hypothetical protein